MSVTGESACPALPNLAWLAVNSNIIVEVCHQSKMGQLANHHGNILIINMASEAFLLTECPSARTGQLPEGPTWVSSFVNPLARHMGLGQVIAKVVHGLVASPDKHASNFQKLHSSVR